MLNQWTEPKHIFPRAEKLVLSLKPPKAKQQFKAYTAAKKLEHTVVFWADAGNLKNIQ